MQRVLVMGATSQIGFFLLPLLNARGLEVTPVTRGSTTTRIAACQTAIRYIHDSGDLRVGLNDRSPFDTAIALTPLLSIPRRIPQLSTLGVRRLIAFGTTGRFYKSNSSDRREREEIENIIAAEIELEEACRRHQISWTLFRPTLVYGCGMDRNVMFIARCVERFGLFPIVGAAKGLRQPVHAEDIAHVCLSAIQNPIAQNRAYNLSGGSTLSYRQLVDSVFKHLNKPARMIRIPLPLFRSIISLAKVLPSLQNLSVDMAARMNIDMCFDHTDATGDLGFSPRPFLLDEQAIPLGRNEEFRVR